MTRRTWIVIVAGLFLPASPVLFARRRKALGTKTRKPRVVSRPQELRGSKEQRIEQNKKAVNLGIGPILTNQELLNMADGSALVELINVDYYFVDRGAVSARKLRRGKKTIVCPSRESRVFVRPHVKPYVELLAKDFFQKFRQTLKITSGARSLEEQTLMRTKGSCYYTPYAAEVNHPFEESLHVRGIAVDVSRRAVVVAKSKLKETSMSRKETDWMRNRLIADKLNGIEFEIEDQEEPIELETEPIEENICYHIVVFPRTTEAQKDQETQKK